MRSRLSARTWLAVALSCAGLISCIDHDADEERRCSPDVRCFRGLVHVDCEGGDASRFACLEDEPDRCLWVTAPCQVGDLSPATVDAIEWSLDVSPEWFSRYWGPAAWTRDVGMVLPVDVAPVADVSEGPSCACRLEGQPGAWPAGACLGPHGVCEADAEIDVRFALESGWTPSRGTLSWIVAPVFASVGFSLVIELDVERRVGRLCLIGQHDAYQPMPSPQCADRGAVTLSEMPSDMAEAEAISIAFTGDFDVVRFTPESEPFMFDVEVVGTISAGRATVHRVPALDR